MDRAKFNRALSAAFGDLRHVECHGMEARVPCLSRHLRSSPDPERNHTRVRVSYRQEISTDLLEARPEYAGRMMGETLLNLMILMGVNCLNKGKRMIVVTSLSNNPSHPGSDRHVLQWGFGEEPSE